MSNTSDTQVIIDAARVATEPRHVDPGSTGPYDYVLLPRSPGQFVVEDLEHFHDKPRRTTQTLTLHEQDSFCDYVNKFKLDRTRIFADKPFSKLTAIIDYHDNDPSFCTHRAVYSLPQSDQWQVWIQNNKKHMSHFEFALFIEDNLEDVVVPAGAKLLEIARTFKAKKDVNFVSSIAIQNGDQQFTYNENTSAGAGARGTMEIPEIIKLGIPVYVGGAAYEIKARLRYRLNDGKLELWYEMVKHKEVLRDAFETVVSEVQTQTKIAPWMASLD